MGSAVVQQYMHSQHSGRRHDAARTRLTVRWAARMSRPACLRPGRPPTRVGKWQVARLCCCTQYGSRRARCSSQAGRACQARALPEACVHGRAHTRRAQTHSAVCASAGAWRTTPAGVKGGANCHAPAQCMPPRPQRSPHRRAVRRAPLCLPDPLPCCCLRQGDGNNGVIKWLKAEACMMHGNVLGGLP